jgi:hypothetical protein
MGVVLQDLAMVCMCVPPMEATPEQVWVGSRSAPTFQVGSTVLTPPTPPQQPTHPTTASRRSSLQVS